MVWEKPMVVARADIKMALELRMVKLGLLFVALIGPIMNIFTVAVPLLFVPPGLEADLLLSILMPMVSSMISMFAIIPAALISANALVGEREQRTLEPLLGTPLTDRELLWGKTLSSFLPSLLLVLLSTALTMIGSNILFLIYRKPLMLIPDLPGLFLILVVSPIMSLAVVSTMILISGRVGRVYEAYQSSSVVIMVFMIPMMGPLIGMELGIPSTPQVWLWNLITFMIALLLFAVTWALAVKRFNRDHMVTMV